MLRGAAIRLLHNPPIETVVTALERLKADGANMVSIVPHHYVSLAPGTARVQYPTYPHATSGLIWPDLGQDPTHPFHNTPDIALVELVCLVAQSMGLTVLLKPHVDSYEGAWRGYIELGTMAQHWARSYRNDFLLPYIRVARKLHNSIFCMGCELVEVTKELGAGYWTETAAFVRRQGYRGPLTYAANWGWADDAEFKRLEALWPVLDCIGVDAYFPLVTDAAAPTGVDDLVAAWSRRGIDADWCPPIDRSMLDLAARVDRPLLFTEVGYPNSTMAALEPARDPQPGDTADDSLQQRLGLAMRQRWERETAFGGFAWWEAWLDRTQVAPISHDVFDRPLEPLLFALSR